MARKISSFMDDGTPPGERDVLNMLREGPEDWFILHSLYLALEKRQEHIEIDIVVIIPDTGILCIDIKLHGGIAFDGQRSDPARLAQSLWQAGKTKFIFCRWMRERLPKYGNVPVALCCIFPRASVDMSPNLPISPWELMDVHAFRALNSPQKFCEDLKKRLKLRIEANGRLNALPTPLSAEDINEIVAACG